MNHVILTAFGTSAAAKDTYHLFETRIAARFPDARRHWFFSSPISRGPGCGRAGQPGSSLGDLLLGMEHGAHDTVVVQSLHLTPGIEFHRLVRELGAAPIDAVIGMPLLNTPEDFHRVARCLLPLLPKPGKQGVLLIGHGTAHPSWTVYPVFEQILRKEAGPHIFLATLGHYPDSAGVIDAIVASGYQDLLVIPLLFVTGTHFHRDIAGRQPGTWFSRLARRGISLTIHDQGLGVLPGIAEIFCDHIQDALGNLKASDKPTWQPGLRRQFHGGPAGSIGQSGAGGATGLTGGNRSHRSCPLK